MDKREIADFPKFAFGNFLYPQNVIRNWSCKKGGILKCSEKL